MLSNYDIQHLHWNEMKADLFLSWGAKQKFVNKWNYFDNLGFHNIEIMI